MARPLSQEILNDPAQAWSPFEARQGNIPWDRAAVAHLHRRAGFAASWDTLERDLQDGVAPSIARLMSGEAKSLDDRPAVRFEAEEEALATRFGGSGNDLPRLQSVWLHRMIFTPWPLRERLTLFWHDHFATSNAKVKNNNLMRRQNDLIRAHALGNFGTLLAEMARDPAMLIWLDCTTNRKAHPNENYAREVMELFALGRGHYTEKDIQEAARAFSGTFVQGDRYREISAQHDEGEKTILGHTGAFKSDDISRILLDQPACAEYISQKLFRYFVSDVHEPSPELIAPLAQAFRESGYEVAAPIRMILSSQLFFDPAMRRKRVKSPVELVIGTVRALEILKPTVPPVSLAGATSDMGQALFAPPSVAGWDWGPSWLNTTTSLARTNFALELSRNNQGFQADKLLNRHGHSADDAALFLADLLLQDGLDDSLRSQLKGSPAEVAALILTAPEYQLA